MSAPNILVVEDEALIADDIERTLIRLGYKVPKIVADGRSAVAEACAQIPALVLMDIKLRGRLDGVDAARLIRERVDVPVVFMTSHSDAATLARASETVPDGYVVKPFGERDLRVTVELALHKHEVARALRAKERWFALTLNSLSEGVITTDESLQVTLVNRAATDWLGRPASDLLGVPLDQVLRVVPDGEITLDGIARRSLRIGHPVSWTGREAPLPESQGGRRLEGSAAPIAPPGASWRGVALVFTDVTQRRQLEQQVTRTERLTALGTLAAGLCHEINNPLTSVLSNLEVGLQLVREQGDEGLLSECLGDGRDAALRISDLVQNVGIFAHPSPGVVLRTSVREVVLRALKLTEHVLRGRVRVELELSDIPDVAADPGRIVQVLINLITNAGHAVVAAGRPDPRIRIRTSCAPQEHVVVEVEDNGTGIDPAHLGHIFDPFFTTKPVGEGTGLGLAISNRIIEGYGGALTVRNQLGGGTVFALRLPSADEAVAQTN